MTRERVRSAARAGLVGAALAACAAAIIVPQAAAQATRTWVSGVGDDANPCSRMAPSKTIPGALPKTVAGGEINALDPGGFGGATITKSITIDMTGSQGGVLHNGSNGFTINITADPTADPGRVVLRGLDMNGAGPGISGCPLRSGPYGVHVVNARSVLIVRLCGPGRTGGCGWRTP